MVDSPSDVRRTDLTVVALLIAAIVVLVMIAKIDNEIDPHKSCAKHGGVDHDLRDGVRVVAVICRDGHWVR